MAKSIIIAVLIVAASVALITLDPLVYAAYREAVPSSETLDAIATATKYVLEPLVVLVGIILYVILIRADRWRRLGVLAGTMVSQGLLVSVLKKVFSRMRPEDLPSRVAFFGPRWEEAYKSFPGGHAAAAFALAAVLAAWHPRWRWAFYAAATVLTLARIHLGKHFLGDCFVGAWLGYWTAQCFLTYIPPRDPR